jgi:hypothetical protein
MSAALFESPNRRTADECGREVGSGGGGLAV